MFEEKSCPADPELIQREMSNHVPPLGVHHDYEDLHTRVPQNNSFAGSTSTGSFSEKHSNSDAGIYFEISSTQSAHPSPHEQNNLASTIDKTRDSGNTASQTAYSSLQTNEHIDRRNNTQYSVLAGL